MKKLKFSVNPELINKFPPKDKRYMAEGFIDIEDTLESLAQSIQEGWAFSYQFLDGRRSKDNFIATDIVAIDVDNGSVISEALKNPVVSSYCSLLYTTSGHTPDHHRYRLVFVLPRTITDASELRAVNVSLCQRLHGDIAATDPARMFYGNNESYPQLLGNEISEAFLEELILDGKTPVISDSIGNLRPVQTRSGLLLDKNFEFKASDGRSLKFSEFNKKTPIYCPFHPDKHPSAFLAFNFNNQRFMRCSTCCKTYWMGNEPEPFNFNSFVNTVKKYKENAPKKRVNTEEGLYRFFVGQVDDVLVDVSSITFDQKKYIDLCEIPNGLTFIKSPKGSGKTTFLKRALEKIIFTYKAATLEAFEENNDPESPSRFYTNKRVLLIGHRQALIREMCQRLYLDCYLDLKASGNGRIPRFGVCLDSLSMAYQNEDTKYDVVIIDESEQVLSHFLSETIGSERIRIFNMLQSLVSNADKVVALDADLGWITFNTISRLAQKNSDKYKPISIYINQFPSIEKPLYIYRRASQLIESIKNNIVEGKKIFISSNSKRKILALEKSIEDLAKSINQEIKTITVTSENSKSNDVQQFIKNITNEIKKYQVILSSPSLGTGIDITFKDDEDYIDCVYGLYENRVNTHTEIDQQLGRVRHPKEVHVWVSAQTFNFETEFEAVKEEYLENNYIVKLFNDKEIANDDLVISSNGIGSFLMMAALIISYQRASKNRLKRNFLEYKEQQGWKLVTVKDDDFLSGLGNAFLKIGKQKLNEITLQRVLNAPPLQQFQYEDVLERMDSNDSDVSSDEFYSYLRTTIELFYREKITKHLLEKDNHGKLRRSIRTYEIVTDKERIKVIAESKNNTNFNTYEFILSEKILANAESKYLFIYKLLSTTPFFKKGIFKQDVEYEAKDLAEFVAVMIKMKRYVENHLQINIRKDIATKPVQQLREILSMVGLDHRRSGTYVKNGIKNYKYKLSADRLNMVNNFVHKRKLHDKEWKFYNKIHGFKDEIDFEESFRNRKAGG